MEDWWNFVTSSSNDSNWWHSNLRMNKNTVNYGWAIDTNLLVALRATDLLLTPIKSRDHILITLQY